ncbi:MAG: 4Fe-4S binding protein [Promethearchaeota archaeon]
MSLPAKKTIEIDENITHYVHKMLNHEMILKYDESKCIECGFCHRVCPVTISIYDEPLKKTAIGTPEEMHVESNKKIVVDKLHLDLSRIYTRTTRQRRKTVIVSREWFPSRI